MGEVRHLLAERRRRRRLAMCAREHRHRSVPPRERAKRVDQALQARQHHRLARLAQHQGPGEIVDILGSAGEVHELQRRLRLLVRPELRAQPVLDRLHVVIGLGLDLLDVLGVGFGELLGEAAQGAQRTRRKRLQFADGALLRERLEPRQLDPDAVADERLLAEVDPQGIEGLGVPAVEGRERRKRRWHGPLLYG